MYRPPALSTTMPELWIGTSGYVYPHWRKGVARSFSTVELNHPFYRVPTAKTFERWRDATPPDFRFSVKVSRVVSHLRRLHDAAEPLGEFVALASRLGDKLGPLLVQLPPSSTSIYPVSRSSSRFCHASIAGSSNSAIRAGRWAPFTTRLAAPAPPFAYR